MDLTRLKHCAKTLRRHQTDAEQKLWYHLRNRQLLNLKFRRQVLIEPYIVDFACFYPKLVIELDGGQHAVQQQYDDNRTKLLQQHGYTVLRFWNHEVLVQYRCSTGAHYFCSTATDKYPLTLSTSKSLRALSSTS